MRDYNLLKNKFLKDHRHAEVSSLFSTPRADVNLQAYLLHDLVIFYQTELVNKQNTRSTACTSSCWETSRLVPSACAYM